MLGLLAFFDPFNKEVTDLTKTQTAKGLLLATSLNGSSKKSSKKSRRSEWFCIEVHCHRGFIFKNKVNPRQLIENWSKIVLIQNYFGQL